MGVATSNRKGEGERFERDDREGRDDSQDLESETDSPDHPLGVMVVFGELAEASEPLTRAELMDRTLLPEPTVEAALGELEATDPFRVRIPRVDNRPKRYFLRKD